MTDRDHIDLVMDDIRNIFGDLKADMRIGFDGVNKRLDDLNGRTRRNESDIAVLQDRSDKSFGIAAAVGTLGAGIIQAVVFLWRSFAH